MTINSLVSVEVHRDPIVTAVLVGRDWGGHLGQASCSITRPMPWNSPRTEAPQPCWDAGPSVALPIQGQSVRQRVGFSLAETQVARGPQHRHLFAGIKLGKMAGPVGWRLSGKQWFVWCESASVKRLRLYHQGEFQNAPQEDCRWSCFRGRMAKPGSTEVWRNHFWETVPSGMGQPRLHSCTEEKFAPWRHQFWILIFFFLWLN